MTNELFREDGYLQSCEATIAQCSVMSNDSGTFTGIEVDQTVFYPMGGGQPGDTGELRRENGDILTIIDTRKAKDGTHWHFVEGEIDLPAGEKVSLQLDWTRRYRLMRAHSCMHMLCAVIDDPVTGGSIRDDGSARLDFDMPEPPDKAALQEKLNTFTQGDHAMQLRWITDEEMAAQPELVRTMSVKPPMGAGKVRLVEFAGADLQPCGGTHVANAGEIGAVMIQSIKKKGKQNRRITVALQDI